MSINPTLAIRNMWLVELLEDYPDGLTLQEIMDEYQSFPPQLGNNVSTFRVSERTIHNWIKEIDDIFHVKIVCGRGKKKYYIETEDIANNPRLESARQIKAGYDQLVGLYYRQRRKSGMTKYGELSLGFIQVGNSMLNEESLTIRYGKEHNEIGINEPCIFKPYFIKVIENECYVIGEIRPVSGLWNERIEVYSLDRLQLIEEGDFPVESYTIPDNFKPKDYYECGSLRHPGYSRYNNEYGNTPMAVFVDAHNDTADYLREHPIAPTQTEIESNRTKNKNIFMVVVKPNEDFFTQILSFGEELTITNPDFLRRKGEDKDDRTRQNFGYQRYKEDLIGYDYGYLNTINELKRNGLGMNKLLQSKYGGLTDDQLVAKYQQGEELCFEFLYKKYSNNIVRYLINLIKNNIKNYTSDFNVAHHLNNVTWEIVYLALKDGKYQESGKFENWIKVIAKSTFWDWCKKRKRELPTVSFEYDESLPQEVDEGPERAIEKKEDLETLNRVIKDLPPELRRVLELDQEGYSHKEIAEMEGITKQTVERRYRSAARAIFGMTH